MDKSGEANIPDPQSQRSFGTGTSGYNSLESEFRIMNYGALTSGEFSIRQLADSNDKLIHDSREARESTIDMKSHFCIKSNHLHWQKPYSIPHNS
jgi:hypothetical protein